MFTELPFRNKSDYGVRTEVLGKGGYGAVHKYKCDKSFQNCLNRACQDITDDSEFYMCEQISHLLTHSLKSRKCFIFINAQKDVCAYTPTNHENL